MNKVIKKMLKEAEEYADTNALLTDELEPMMLEHFAELIVQECARIARNANLEDVEGGDSAVLRAAGDQIEDYFGVE